MFKLNLIAVLFCITAFSAFAQDEEVTTIGKGNWIVGGNVSLSAPQGLNDVSFLINPKASYFVGKKLALGLSATYQYNGIFNTQNVGIGPAVRYYFKNARLAPFAEMDYSFARTKAQRPTAYGNESTFSNNSTYGAGAGLDFFVTKNIAIEGVFKYNLVDRFDNGTFNFNFGLQFFLGRKNK